jgi:hypothetical protein
VAEPDQRREYRELPLVGVRTSLEDASDPQGGNGRACHREYVEGEEDLIEDMPSRELISIAFSLTGLSARLGRLQKPPALTRNPVGTVCCPRPYVHS